MNQKYYTAERSVQILISLLKQHGIKRIVASPGTTNLTFVASIMQDSWFEMYSSVDERSAAYMACSGIWRSCRVELYWSNCLAELCVRIDRSLLSKVTNIGSNKYTGY
jgi:hypothetical protein